MSDKHELPVVIVPNVEAGQVIDRLQGDEGGIKVKLVASVALLAAGAVVYGIFSQSPEQNIQEEQTKALGSVSSVISAGLDCEPLVTSDISLQTRTKLELPRGLASITRVETVPASGFLTFIRDETAAEFTKGRYQTLGCLPKNDVQIKDNLDTKTREIVMNQAGMRLFTREEADQTTLVFESPALSAMGEILAKFSKLGSFGQVEKFEDYVNETKAEVGATTKQMAENFVEQECFTAAYDTTKKVVSLALIEDAKKDGFELAAKDIKWIGTVPTFNGPYQLDGENGSFKVEVDKYAVNDCVVDPDLLKAVKAVELEDTIPTLSPGMEQ